MCGWVLVFVTCDRLGFGFALLFCVFALFVGLTCY